jgi:hypothetical protein
MLLPLLVLNLQPVVGTGTAHFEVSDCARDRPLANATVSIDGVVYGSTNAIGVLDVILSAGDHSYQITHDPIVFTGSYPVFAQSRLATLQTAAGSFTAIAGRTVELLVCLEETAPSPGLRLWGSRFREGWTSQVTPLE